MRLCASLFRRRRGPAGPRDLFASAEVAACTPCAQCFPNVRDEGWYHYPRSVSHGSETLRGRVSERHTLPLLGLDRVCSQRTQRAFGTAMRSCASLLRRRRGPAGLRDLFTFVEIAACTPYSRYFFRFSRRSSLCCSCANLISARSFSARSCSRVFGFVIVLDLLF